MYVCVCVCMYVCVYIHIYISFIFLCLNYYYYYVTQVLYFGCTYFKCDVLNCKIEVLRRFESHLVCDNMLKFYSQFKDGKTAVNLAN